MRLSRSMRAKRCPSRSVSWQSNPSFVAIDARWLGMVDPKCSTSACRPSLRSAASVLMAFRNITKWTLADFGLPHFFMFMSATHWSLRRPYFPSFERLWWPSAWNGSILSRNEFSILMIPRNWLRYLCARTVTAGVATAVTPKGIGKVITKTTGATTAVMTVHLIACRCFRSATESTSSVGSVSFISGFFEFYKLFCRVAISNKAKKLKHDISWDNISTFWPPYMKVGINGFGRIGRAVARIAESKPWIDITVINTRNTPTELMAHLLEYDSVYGKLWAEISHDEEAIYVDGRKIICTHHSDPGEIPWDHYSIYLSG